MVERIKIDRDVFSKNKFGVTRVLFRGGTEVDKFDHDIIMKREEDEKNLLSYGNKFVEEKTPEIEKPELQVQTKNEVVAEEVKDEPKVEEAPDEVQPNETPKSDVEPGEEIKPHNVNAKDAPTKVDRSKHKQDKSKAKK